MGKIDYKVNDVFRYFDGNNGNETISVIDKIEADQVHYTIVYSDTSKFTYGRIDVEAFEVYFRDALQNGVMEKSRLCLQQTIKLREGSVIDAGFDNGLIENFVRNPSCELKDISLRNAYNTWSITLSPKEFFANFYLNPEVKEVVWSEPEGYTQGYLEGHSGLKWL